MSCKDTAHEESSPVQNEEPVKLTPNISYSIVNEFPHDATAFTEGLEYYNGHLYEGTGEYGTSDIRKTDVETGKILSSKKLPDKYFGEGITIFNGKLYQLTYREGTVFVYDASSFEQLNSFSFSTGEGWGMTHDSASLIYSDGTSNIYFVNPENFSQKRQITVKDNFGAVTNINELEYIGGYIYANLWQTSYIIKIDPNSGKVLGQLDLTSLRQNASIPASADVLNGIAYDESSDRIFITGKYWPKLFEIKLNN